LAANFGLWDVKQFGFLDFAQIHSAHGSTSARDANGNIRQKLDVAYFSCFDLISRPMF
jgi:hypothetical protein